MAAQHPPTGNDLAPNMNSANTGRLWPRMMALPSFSSFRFQLKYHLLGKAFAKCSLHGSPACHVIDPSWFSFHRRT